MKFKLNMELNSKMILKVLKKIQTNNFRRNKYK